MSETRSDQLEALRRRIAAIENASAIERTTAENGSAVDGVYASRTPSQRRRLSVKSDTPLNPNDDAPEKRKEGAFERIERLVSFRDYAGEEMKRRLAREEYDEGEIDEAVARAVRCGLIDDARFADAYVRGRLSKGCGVSGIESSLAQLGIDAADIEGWPEDYLDGADETDRALAVLDAKPPRAKNMREAAYRRLMGKGYGSDVSARAARIWSERSNAPSPNSSAFSR